MVSQAWSGPPRNKNEPMTPHEAIERLRQVLRNCRMDYHYVPSADDDEALKIVEAVVNEHAMCP